MDLFLPPPHPATLSDEDLLAQCELGKGRSGGPGGQHRNKVETKVTLTHTPTGIQAQAGERRSVRDNTREALFRLRLALATTVRTPIQQGEARTDLWRARCAGGTVSCNPGHRDYPALLALAMDIAAAANWDTRKAAARLCCTPSQLLKLIKDHPPAWVRLNEGRATRRKRPLR